MFSVEIIGLSKEVTELTDAYSILQNNILAIQIRVKEELRNFVRKSSFHPFTIQEKRTKGSI
jgi:hypothetical protein